MKRTGFKKKPLRQSKLTKAALGQECTIQIHPYCNCDSETVVLCHAPSDSKGMSCKSEDWWGADGCSACHEIVDRKRFVDLSREEIDACFLRGIHRTINRRINQGLIQV